MLQYIIDLTVTMGEAMTDMGRTEIAEKIAMFKRIVENFLHCCVALAT